MDEGFQNPASLESVEQAVLDTIAYADIFSYPLTAGEVHRYLHGFPVPYEMVCELLHSDPQLASQISQRQGYFMLRGREDLIALRLQRAARAALLWPQALLYARWIARLPFVRMLAITGALAVDNEPGQDIDYLIVTSPGRLWLCRGLVILVVRLASLRGDVVCPNYLITEHALAFPDCNLYSAHELAQMVPLYGLDVYWKIRQFNPWLHDYLPNAGDRPRPEIPSLPQQCAGFLQQAAENALGARLGTRLETWEMQRKLRKFARVYPSSREADFSADWCKGHFGEYGARTLSAYQTRLRPLQ